MREFRGKTFHSTSKENCTIEVIGDIGVVEEGDMHLGRSEMKSGPV